MIVKFNKLAQHISCLDHCVEAMQENVFILNCTPQAFYDAGWHKSKDVREYLETTKRFQLYNFPPYAPDLNPQEHVWKEMREKGQSQE